MTRMSTLTTVSALLLAAGSAFAQPATTPAPAAPPETKPATPAAQPATTTTTVTTTTTQRVRSTGIPQRDTLNKMMRSVSIEFKEHRLEDVIKFITEVTQADIEVFWQDERNSTGLDKDMPITLKQEKGTALDLLIKVLDKAATDTSHANSWQMSDDGTLQAGPKERLNKYKTVKLYSIADLLVEIPDYVNAPEFDLQTVLQNQGGRGGGGGGQSPFRDNNQQPPPRKTAEERAREIQDILITLVEPEQWTDSGGDGASIRYFQGNFLVNAPDYIHRQIDGYPYWPAADTKVAMVNGRRYVTLGVDTATSKIRGFTNQPISGQVGGGDAGGNPGGVVPPP